MLSASIFRIFSAVAVMCLLSSCQFQVENSSSNDEFVYGEEDNGNSGGSSDRFGAARTILRRNCASCHGEFATYTESDFLRTGYVIARSSSQSILFTKLQNAGYGGNMPPSSALSPEDIVTIRDWIDHISNSNSGGTTGGAGDAASRRQAAFAVLNTKCKTCHTVARIATSNQYSGRALPAWGNFLNDSSDNNFVTTDLVFPGMPTQSWLYRALKTYGDLTGGVGFELMPVSGAAITATEEQAVREWIIGIGNP